MSAVAWSAALLMIGLCTASGCASCKKFAYEGFNRDGWQQPERVIEVLAIAPGAHVADLGAGGGYFTFRLADAVGPTGVVYAIDVDAEMLAYLRQQAAADGYANVETIEAGPDDPRLPPAGVDLLFSCNTYHHLGDRTAYFARLTPSLRPGARVAILDGDGSGFFGWLFGHATPPETVRAEMEAAGYRLEAHHTFVSGQGFLVFSVAP